MQRKRECKVMPSWSAPVCVLLPEIPALVPRARRAPTAIMGPLVEGGLVIGAGNGGYQRQRAYSNTMFYCVRKGCFASPLGGLDID